MTILTIGVVILLAYSLGVLTGKSLPPSVKELPPFQGSLPLKTMVEEFRGFVAALEGGVIPGEVEEALKMLAEHASSSARPKEKPLLKGHALIDYRADMDASKTPKERGSVVIRWHKKGYVFSRELRRECLHAAIDEAWRNTLREMFDEQANRW